MKEFYIADAPRFENQEVTSYFCLSSLGVRERRGGGQYLALTFSDKSGQMDARMWDEFADVVGSCSEGCYVKARGQISKYGGRFQITVTRMRSAPAGEIEAADFIPSTQFDVAQMAAELRGHVDRMSEPALRRLLYSFLDDPEIGPAFVAAPAAKRLHHAWLGGLLEHVLSLVRVCLAVAPSYPEVNQDLLVAGALLHDIGKVRELRWRQNFEYTLEGQLLGHITIGQRMLAERISVLNAESAASVEGSGAAPEVFPERLRLLLEHMLLSHHGRLEFGSPKLPMIAEAMLLSALDDLEAKFQTLRTELGTARASGRGAGEMTDWVRSMDRNLLDSRAFLAEAEESAPAPAVDVAGSRCASFDAEIASAQEANADSRREPEDTSAHGAEVDAAL